MLKYLEFNLKKKTKHKTNNQKYGQNLQMNYFKLILLSEVKKMEFYLSKIQNKKYKSNIFRISGCCVRRCNQEISGYTHGFSARQI